uniref:microtubule-severing ATPase n=1 Tax=Globisporangium ultimum (strain ATCC 200006 / CBS 805.95 / DAOM BR144) TaxID=431595 RepID=K3W6T0_GLOUD
MAWLTPNKSDDAEIKQVLDEAVKADSSGDFACAVDLYADAIEKMMQKLQQLTHADEKKKFFLRETIHHYMTRAESLKEQLLQREHTLHGRTTARTNEAAAASSGHGAQSVTNGAATPSAFLQHHTQHAHTILDEVLDRSPKVHWDDIAGLHIAKQILQEAVIYPSLRPDLFTGLLAPPRGVLLFGPPGTGKTLLAKAVATESNATFFNISASTLTSKWVGEGEKLVRTLFAIARELQPAVIFLDEMDALLSTRSASENDASRRIKNQFFTELDGAASSPEDRILVMGATNLPQELDEAIIRRLEKRIYVPLPDETSRETLIRHLIGSQKYAISSHEMANLVKATDGYSGSDLKALCKDAAMGPIRELGARIRDVKSEDVRGVHASDFKVAISRVRPSVSKETINSLLAWNELYGVSAVAK